MSNSEKQRTIKILFLSADPTEASRLRLGQELRDIREKLQLSKERNRFHLESRECVRPHDISQFIFDIEPHIIHFAGHSTNAGELCFEDISGNINPIKPDALAGLFELLNEDINCVVLNACYSAKQAKAIARHIPYVIGMNQAIQDKAAIIFAVGFYKAIGAGKTIDDAFEFGKLELQLLGISEDMIPILHTKRKVREPKNITPVPPEDSRLGSRGEKNASVILQREASKKLQKEEAEPKVVITITGSLKDLNGKFISKLLADFQEMSDDASIKIDKIESGSIKITLSGNPEGLETLATLMQSEKITQKLGISVKEVELLSGDHSSRYWTIWRMSLSSTKAGYTHSLVSMAREFFQTQVANSQLEDTQTALLSYFYAKKSTDNMTAALAGLCLRCYVSESILKACKKIDFLFGNEKHFNYRDLLPYVLNDDGETLVVLGSDLETHLILDKNGETHPASYKFFSVKVLQTFKTDSQHQMRLDNWTYLQINQNSELKDFLSECGFKHFSDWALLNQDKPKHLELLSVYQRHLLEVFHAVYRRDRLQQHHKGARRCPDPTKIQLQEMLDRLQHLGIIIHSTTELLKEIKQVATQLRHYDIWSYREPIEIQYPDTVSYTSRSELPIFFDVIDEQLKLALDTAIKQEIPAIITKLEKSKNYAPLVQKLIPGLQLYYCEQLSLKDITPQMGMTSWDETRRILNPGELLNKVRTSTVEQLLKNMLKKASEKGLTKIPPEPEYLRKLLVQIEEFCDREIFTEAAEEIRSGQNRVLDSFYAERIRLYLQQHQ